MTLDQIATLLGLDCSQAHLLACQVGASLGQRPFTGEHPPWGRMIEVNGHRVGDLILTEQVASALQARNLSPSR